MLENKCPSSCFAYLLFAHFSDLLDSAPMLLIGTTSTIIQVNARTLEPTQYINLQGKHEIITMFDQFQHDLSDLWAALQWHLSCMTIRIDSF